MKKTKLLMFVLIATFEILALPGISKAAAPIVTLVSPADNAISKNIYNDVSFSVDEASGNYDCTLVAHGPDGTTNATWEFSPDGLEPGHTEYINGSTFTSPVQLYTVPDGVVSWSVSCTNVAMEVGTSTTRTYTVDTAKPSVDSIVNAKTTLTKSDRGGAAFEVIVNYDESMDQSDPAKPVISYDNPSPSAYPLGLEAGTCEGNWVTSTQYRFPCNLNGGTDELVNNIDIRVTGGKDLAGNVQNDGIKADAFNINTTDMVAAAFSAVATTLRSAGIANNLDTVTDANYTTFSGLYFEKRTDVNDPTTAIGRITFNSALDLSDSETTDFLQSLGSKFDAGTAGTIGLNFTGASDAVALKGISATIKFYGLNALGFDASSTVAEINSKLLAYDDAGNLLDKSALISDGGTYLGACEVGGGCYVFTVGVNHFTKYKIGDNSKDTTVKKDGHNKYYKTYKKYKKDFKNKASKTQYDRIRNLKKTDNAEFLRIKDVYNKYKTAGNKVRSGLSSRLLQDYKNYRAYQGYHKYLDYKKKAK
jgi:hypothetical protein